MRSCARPWTSPCSRWRRSWRCAREAKTPAARSDGVVTSPAAGARACLQRPPSGAFASEDDASGAAGRARARARVAASSSPRRARPRRPRVRAILPRRACSTPPRTPPRRAQGTTCCYARSASRARERPRARSEHPTPTKKTRARVLTKCSPGTRASRRASPRWSSALPAAPQTRTGLCYCAARGAAACTSSPPVRRFARLPKTPRTPKAPPRPPSACCAPRARRSSRRSGGGSASLLGKPEKPSREKASLEASRRWMVRIRTSNRIPRRENSRSSRWRARATARSGSGRRAARLCARCSWAVARRAPPPWTPGRTSGSSCSSPASARPRWRPRWRPSLFSEQTRTRDRRALDARARARRRR